MVGMVASIVKNDVNAPHFRYHRPNKIGISLRSYSDISMLSVELSASRFDIDPEDSRFRPEVIPPQL